MRGPAADQIFQEFHQAVRLPCPHLRQEFCRFLQEISSRERLSSELSRKKIGAPSGRRVFWLAVCFPDTSQGETANPDSNCMAEWWRVAVVGLAMTSLGASSYESANFQVTAPTAEIARQVALAAEKSREELAVVWFGKELPRWSARCQVTVVVGTKLGAGGSTKFRFDNGHVFGWRMRVQGSLERILDSVIPHEVNHTILACYFRRPVPRWADEGAASLMEHASEQQHQIDLVNRLMHEGRRIPLRMLLNIAEYPRDMKQVMALYAEGYSLTEYLIQLGGRKQFLRFLDDAHHRSWDKAILSFYEFGSIEKLEQNWSRWVLAGSPRLDSQSDTLLASSRSDSASSRTRVASAGGATIVNERPRPRDVVRSQTPEPEAGSFAPSRLPGLARIKRSLVRAPSPFGSNPPRTRPAAPVVRPAPRKVAALVPLALKPLALAPVSKHPRRNAGIERTMPEQFPVPMVSEELAFGRRLRETHIRTSNVEHREKRAATWTQFPRGSNVFRE